MTNLSRRLSTTLLIPVLLGCSIVQAKTDGVAEIILPADSRFNVFELSNSRGDGTFASPVGKVLLSFVSKDGRYCRAARFPSDSAVVLACREERGWKTEAISRISRAEANYPANFGGNMPEVGEAVEAMRASADLLDELEIMEAAARGWRDPAPLDVESLDARHILKRTSQIYRASKTYVDSGAVETVYITPSSKRTGETRFTTAYVAPDDFRFESTMNDFGTIEANFVVGQDGNGVNVWFSVEPELMKDIATVQEALDAGAGISRDTSGMIPGLIFPGTKLGGDIVRLTDAVRLDDMKVDGVDCFQIQGFRQPNTGQPTTVWIEKDSFLIRRVYEEQDLKEVATKTTWSYSPAINVPVDQDALRF